MSLFNDASLVMIPSGYKTSKVYSVKPTDGSGDLTFTRSNDTATRVGPNGLIEKVRTNLALYSEDFSQTGTWVTSTTTRVDSQTDPNGGTTASKFTATGANSNVIQTRTVSSGTPYTWSFYAKSDSATDVNIRLDNGNGNFVQTNMALTTSWQRFSITLNSNATTIQCYLGGGLSFTIGEVAYIAFAQLEVGDVMTDYIATTSAAVSVGPVANVPRLDYLNSSCPRLLLEPTATTLMTYSESLDNAAWDKTSGGAAITANAVTSPDGYTNADTITGTGASVAFVLVRQTISVPSAATYTFSGFFKYNNHPFVSLNLSAYDGGGIAYYNIQTGVVGTVSAGSSATITDYGNGWYRCTLTSAIGASDLTGRPSIYVAYEDGTSDFPSTAAATGKAAYAWGINLTQSAYATSYIGPTLGAAVTRGADAASKTGISSLIGSSAGTMYVDLNDFDSPSSAQNGDLLSIENSTGALGAILLLINRTSKNLQLYQLPQNTTVTIKSGVNTNQRLKVAIVYNGSSYKAFVNGAQTYTGTLTATTGLSVIKMNPSINKESIAKINQVLLFTSPLTDAQALELTTI